MNDPLLVFSAYTLLKKFPGIDTATKLLFMILVNTAGFSDLNAQNFLFIISLLSPVGWEAAILLT